MRKKNQEIKDRETIERILREAKICRMAMSDGNSPYLLPFNYGYRDHHIYIHAAPEGKKIDILKKNNKVCFEIENDVRIVSNEIPCKWYTSYQSIIGSGTVEIIDSMEGKRDGLDIIMKHHGSSGNQDYPTTQLKNMVILKMKISELSAKQSSDYVNINN